MTRSRSLFASLAASIAIASVHGQAPPQQGTWFSVQNTSQSRLRREIERRTIEGLDLARVPSSAQTLSEALERATPGDLVYVAGPAADITSFIATDQRRHVDRLKLDVVNGRAGITPLYLFTNVAKASSLGPASTAPRVRYLSRAGDLDPDDVATIIARGVGTKPMDVFPVDDAAVLAERLLADNSQDGVDVVAIYDEDPSPSLHEFLRFYDAQRANAGPAAEQQLLQFWVQPTGSTVEEREKRGTRRLRPVNDRLAYTLVPFNEVAFDRLVGVEPEQKDGVLAMPASGDASSESLLVLSNVRTVRGEGEYNRVRQLLGDAYFVGLMASVDFRTRCTSQGEGFGSYLIDAQLSDRENVAKALAVWSDFILRAGSGRGNRLQRQHELARAVLRDQLEVQMDNGSELAARLRGPLGDTRAQFSGDESTLFKQAVVHIETAMQTPDPARQAAWLALGRAKLLTLIEKNVGPACKGHGAGLFGAGLDPFFYLGLVDAYAELQNLTLVEPGAR